MKGINNDKLLKAAQQVQEEYPEEVQIAYFGNGKGAVYASPEGNTRIMELLKEGVA